ncbi:hypothetical protein ACOME3_005406 [Neoechinorhynchus agilis]
MTDKQLGALKNFSALEGALVILTALVISPFICYVISVWWKRRNRHEKKLRDKTDESQEFESSENCEEKTRKVKASHSENSRSSRSKELSKEGNLNEINMVHVEMEIDHSNARTPKGDRGKVSRMIKHFENR